MKLRALSIALISLFTIGLFALSYDNGSFVSYAASPDYEFKSFKYKSGSDGNVIIGNIKDGGEMELTKTSENPYLEDFGGKGARNQELIFNNHLWAYLGPSVNDNQDRYAISVNKSEPTKGTLFKSSIGISDIGGGDTGHVWLEKESYTLSGNEEDIPDSLQTISSGMIKGRIFFSPENVSMPSNIYDRQISLCDYSYSTYQQCDANKIGDFLDLHEINGTVYYTEIDLSAIKNDDSSVGLYPGRYKLKYYWNTGWTLQKDDPSKGAFQNLVDPTGMEVRGTVSFELSQEGTIKILSSDENEHFENNVQEKTLAQLTSEDGVDLTLTYSEWDSLSLALSKAAGWLISFINKTTEWASESIIKVLNKGNEVTENPGIEKSWGVLRDTAISLLMVAIIIIAFTNVLSIDLEQYGVQRLIPKLVIGVVFTYFSFLVATVIMEFASALQAQLQTMFGSGSKPINFQIDSDSLGDLATNIGMVLLIAIGAIVLIIALIYLYLVLIARVVFLGFLIVLAPLAFIFSILPLTESLYKQWWSEFTKWVFMGPAIVLFLVVGNILINAAGTSADGVISVESLDQLYVVLTAAVAYGAAAMIPTMMGGKIMASVSGKALGFMKWGGKMTPGYKTGAAMIAQRRKDKERKIGDRALGYRARLGKVPGIGRLAGYPSKMERDTALSRYQDAVVTEKAKLLQGLSRDELNERLVHLTRTNQMGRKDRDIQAITRTLADKTVLAGAPPEEGKENYDRDMAIYKAQQQAIERFTPSDGTLFSSILKDNAAAGIRNNFKGIRIASTEATKKKALERIDDNALNALAEVSPEVVSQYSTENVKRALDRGDPRLVKAMGEKVDSFNPEAQDIIRQKLKLKPPLPPGGQGPQRPGGEQGTGPERP